MVGYGVTGAVILDYLVAARCAPVVTTRQPKALERARQCGATPVAYAERVAAMGDADIVVNTVPSTDAVPSQAFAALREPHRRRHRLAARGHGPRGGAGGGRAGALATRPRRRARPAHRG